jgi:hypothetical protein
MFGDATDDKGTWQSKKNSKNTEDSIKAFKYIFMKSSLCENKKLN